MLAVTEALISQFYLVTVIAMLVSRVTVRRPPGAPAAALRRRARVCRPRHPAEGPPLLEHPFGLQLLIVDPFRPLGSRKISSIVLAETGCGRAGNRLLALEAEGKRVHRKRPDLRVRKVEEMVAEGELRVVGEVAAS